MDLHFLSFSSFILFFFSSQGSRDGPAVVGAASHGDLAKGHRFNLHTRRDPRTGSHVEFATGRCDSRCTVWGSAGHDNYC